VYRAGKGKNSDAITKGTVSRKDVVTGSTHTKHRAARSSLAPTAHDEPERCKSQDSAGGIGIGIILRVILKQRSVFSDLLSIRIAVAIPPIESWDLQTGIE
jgi:hypothetical protein